MSQRWANKMRSVYVGIFLILLTLSVSPFIYRMLTVPPTCTDGIQNQGETAPDLSGPCRLLNPDDLKPLTVRWARSFMVVDGIYSAVAYVENQNAGGGIRTLHYLFRLYDENNILVTERVGNTFIPAGKVVPIFEGNLEVGGRVPVRTSLEFIDTLSWEIMESEREAELDVASQTYTITNGLPRLNAILRNRGVYLFNDLVVVATLFDQAGNALAASRTVVPALAPDSEKQIVFTWPQAFAEQVSKVDVVPLIPPVYMRDF